MEAILNSLTDEKRKISIPWKQIAGAILLAMAVTILCIYVSKSRDAFTYKVKPVMGISNMESESKIKLTLQELILLNDKDKPLHINSPIVDSNSVLPVISDMNQSEQKISAKSKTKEFMQEKVSKENVQRQTGIVEKESVSELREPEKSIENAVGELPLVREISLELYGNGGIPECLRDTCSVDDFDIGKYEQPERLGKLFDGWYADKNCTMPFERVEENVTSLKLYAGWKEFPGFISNDKGHIIGYTNTSKFLGDNLMVLPSYKTCTGIEKEAINGLEDEIYEIYIPANITYIEMDIFNKLPNLLYIQVQSGNPEFYSENGKLYYHNGEIAAIPKGLE